MDGHGDGAGEVDGLRHEPIKEIVRTDGAVIVRLRGELDLYNADAVRQALLGSTEQEPPRLVVDLGEVTFVDSTALGVLIEARTKLPNRHAFLLASPTLEARRALEVSGLDRHFSVHETVDDALATTL